MKVALLSTFYPYRGGIAQFNAAIYRELENSGHEVNAYNFSRQYPSMLFPGKTQYVDEDDLADEIPSERILDSMNPLSWIKTAKKINQFKPDVVIIPFWTPFLGPALGAVVKRLEAAKTIGLFHNAVPHEAKFSDKFLTKMLLSKVDEVLVLSESVKNETLALRPHITVRVHPHPLYTHFEEATHGHLARKKLDLDAKLPVILFFGLIRPYKGLETLLKAFDLMKTPAQLLVAGEAYESVQLYEELAANSKNAEHIHFHFQYISDQELPDYFGAADLVALPYLNASQSGVTAIALHYELPIVASDVGGLSEYILENETGYLVSAGSSQELAEAIDLCISNLNELPKLPALNKLKAKLSWSSLVDALLNS